MNSQPQHSNLDEKLSNIYGLVLGILFIVGGFWVRHIDIHERATLTQTQGTVVDTVSRKERYKSENKEKEKEKETYAPVIEFLVNGKPTRFTGNYESNRSNKGHKVIVRYDPKQPATTARMVKPLEGFTPWGMFGVGGFAVVYSIVKLLPLFGVGTEQER